MHFCQLLHKYKVLNTRITELHAHDCTPIQQYKCTTRLLYYTLYKSILFDSANDISFNRGEFSAVVITDHWGVFFVLKKKWFIAYHKILILFWPCCLNVSWLSKATRWAYVSNTKKKKGCFKTSAVSLYPAIMTINVFILYKIKGQFVSAV